MSDPPHSDIDFKNKMAWVWTTLKFLTKTLIFDQNADDGTLKSYFRIWDAKTGFLIQTLEGHTDDIFAASFSYDGTTIITASKDNTCRVWR